MKSRVAVLGAIATIALSLAAAAPARALPNPAYLPCQEAIAKNGAKFVNAKLKALQKCNNKDLKASGSCDHAAVDTKIDGFQAKMNAGIESKCSQFAVTILQGLGFPGKCADATPGDSFNLSDLEACIFSQHEETVDSLIDIEYGTTTGPIADSGVLKCQATLAKDGGKVVKATLKAVQKCRNAINKGTITGILPKNCATADQKTADNINKAVSKAQADITVKCTDAQVQQLDVCNPNATTATDAASCIVSTHQLAVDDPAPTSGDLIDFEYATPASCGDGVVNSVLEECDGSDLSGCTAQGFSGPCGAPDSNFACLCLDIPRERVVEHSTADLDNGWSGQSHDSGVVEGGGYIADMYDCDNVSDFLCTVGPSCSGGAHNPCTNDGQCALLGQGTCRRRAASLVGPHCKANIQQTCPIVGGGAVCTGPNDACLTTFHGPPLPLSAGGISVCVLNVFTEDVVGTKDLTTGSSAVRIRQGSITNLGPSQAQPCPVCGGFCDTPAGGNRRNCTTDADCALVSYPGHPAGTVGCKHDFVCSGGPNVDKECRPDPPFGGQTTLFGNTSVDCTPTPNLISPAAGLDILFNPATTGTTTLLPTVQCDDLAFNNKRCMGGTSDGRVCTVASECPGGTCSFQCFCPNGGGQKQRPNGCDPACVGGGADGGPCDVDTDCPGGFCHPADCRPDPLAAPAQQPNEGACTVTVEGHCTVSAFKTCSSDAQCQAPSCVDCQPGETCNIVGKNCFINSGIVRTGEADPTNPISAATFCIAQTNQSSVNSTAGLPGPGGLFQPATTISTGF